MTEQTTPSGRPLIPDTASWLQRVGALAIDWAASYLAVVFILGGTDNKQFSWVVLAAFWLQSSVGVALVGGSFGQMILRLRVHEINGRPLTLLKALQRQLLICLVVPPLVFRSDGRGLHDLLTNSAVFPRRLG
ncbi:putative RDD family membrane protein YckC [Marmoricola sp. OAE513]|uniref:RDD family protein n=1 Tax=Marmoricola sp. OAE513 TaxID=2817894 RepID=UPI001AE85087